MHRLLLFSSGLISLASVSMDAASAPLQQWTFGPAEVKQATVRAVVGPWSGTAERPLVVEQGALVLDGHTSLQVDGVTADDLPTQDLTVEA